MGRLTRLFCLSWITFCCSILGSVWSALADPTIIDHRHTDITQISQAAIEQARSNLVIAYGHTSHGSQLTTGMSGLVGFANNGGLGLSLPEGIFAYNNGGTGGALDLRDRPFSGASDLGNPNRTAWANATRTYLNSSPDVNVIIWSWCGQAGDASEADIDTYLNLMNDLETDYPDVQFIYMTGHLDGSGLTGNLHLRNEQIRNYCNNNDKILYDFADIESYDPDGLVNYNELRANDNCDYDSDGNGSRDANWAVDWQDTHTQNYDWYSCSSAHSQALNANRKAYAAWWLWATLAGWNPSGQNRTPVLQTIGDRQVVCDQSLSFTVMATDMDSTDTLTYNATPLPNGATFDNDQGAFSWTPAAGEEGDYPVTFSVTDDGAPQGTDQEAITISVLAPGSNPGPGNETESDSNGCFINLIW